MHHSITDGIGAVNLLLELFDLDPGSAPARHARSPTGRCHASPGRLRRFPQPRAPPPDRHPEPPGQRCRGRGARRSWPTPSARSTPTTEMVASAGRLLTPAPNPRSPIMTGRSLSIHLDTIALPLAASQEGGPHDRRNHQRHVRVGCRPGRPAVPPRPRHERRPAPRRDADQHPRPVRRLGGRQRLGAGPFRRSRRVERSGGLHARDPRPPRVRPGGAREPARRPDVERVEPAPHDGRHADLRVDDEGPRLPGVERAGVAGSDLPPGLAGSPPSSRSVRWPGPG